NTASRLEEVGIIPESEIMSPHTLFSLQGVGPQSYEDGVRPHTGSDPMCTPQSSEDGVRPRTGSDPKLTVALAMAALLSGCANMTDTPPGTALQDVEARYGKAGYSCPADQGKQRLIWTQQPYGQYAWTALVDENGKVDRIVPALTDARFRILDTGSWAPDQVRCKFGPPAEISTIGLPGSRQVVWSYRYKQDGVWNSLMYIYFGSDGA